MINFIAEIESSPPWPMRGTARHLLSEYRLLASLFLRLVKVYMKSIFHKVEKLLSVS